MLKVLLKMAKFLGAFLHFFLALYTHYTHVHGRRKDFFQGGAFGDFS